MLFGVQGLELFLNELANRLSISPQAFGKWVKKGGALQKTKNLELIDLQP